MRQFKYSSAVNSTLNNNPQHKFAMNHTMMLYRSNALYSFIPKNACSTMRLSVAIENGCIDSIDNGHWIHANNGTFNASLAESINVNYAFVILRCPFKRLVSVFLDKFVAKEPPAWQYRDRMGRKINLDSLSFREFVCSLQKPGFLRSDIHWRPQVDFLLYQKYDDYFSFENFSDVTRVLKEKVKVSVVDARELTQHGTHKLEKIDDRLFADMEAFDIAIMKRSGQCPDYKSMYDKELHDIVSRLFQSDINFYAEKFGDENLLKI